MKRFKALLIALVVFILMFTVVDKFVKAPDIVNLNNGKVELIGHAGSGFAYLINPWNPYPANSEASILKAIDNGANGLELDIQASKDTILMLFHDLELGSKTGKKGCICDYNQSELEQTEFKEGWPYDWFQNEKIISFNRIADNTSNLKIYFDLKISTECSLNQQEQFTLITHALRKYYESKQYTVTLISADENQLIGLKQLYPDWDYSLEANSDFEQAIVSAKLNGFNSLCISAKNATKKLSAKIHENGIRVVLYGGKSKLGLRRILELNPDVVQVNNVKAVKSLLN